MRFRFQAFGSRSSQYRPDIDGLRAVAVVAVVLSHIGVSKFAGGYVGVDIFFVISGYLITSILIREMEAGSFSFAGFYERRIRRIFPALIAVALASLVVFTVLLTPKDLVLFGQNLMAMCGFVSNIFLAQQNQQLGYFDRAANEQALLHTWSLAVEEQFYFFFPAALLLIEKFAKPYRRVFFVVFGVASFFYGLHDLHIHPTTTYFSFPARGWELLLGALIAGEGLLTLRWRAVREVMNVVGVALIGYAIFMFNSETVFPGLNALAPCVGAMLILYAGRDGDSLVKRALGFKPVVFVGVISYSLYLWHWPVLVAVRYVYSLQLFTTEMMIGVGLVSLLLAFLSFELIESPFRGGHSGSGRKRAFICGIGASAVLACAGLLLVNLGGLPQRYRPGLREVVAQNEAQVDDWVQTGACANFQNPIQTFSDVRFCKLGYAAKNILFIGDSMVEQLYPLMERYAKDGALRGRGVVTAMAAGCPPLIHLNHAAPGYQCDRFAQYAMERGEQDDIDTVFIQFSPWWSGQNNRVCLTDGSGCVKSLMANEAKRTSGVELTAEIEAFKKAHKRVILGLPYPFYMVPIPGLMAHNAVFGRFRGVSAAPEAGFPAYARMEADLARQLEVSIYDPRAALCPGDGACVYQTHGISLYKDGSHLSADGVRILHDGLLEALNRAQ